MSEPKPPHDPLALLFRDVVRVLGGVFTIQGTDDETVCRIARGLDRAWRRARGIEPVPFSSLPHPAIAGLLRLTDEGGRASDEQTGESLREHSHERERP